MSLYQEHEVPEGSLVKWQETVNIIARLFEVPAGLIMRVGHREIEVLVSSHSEGNPYKRGEKADLGTGLYCETVMASRSQLQVPNALQDEDWKDNPDVKLDMISYLGIPLVWPDGKIFGTICVLDNKTKNFSELYQALLWEFKNIIESDFRIMQQNKELKQGIVRRKQAEEALQRSYDELDLRVQERTSQLYNSNIQLEQEIAERKKVEEERQKMDEKLRETQKLESLGVLAGGIAHDFNNILTGILGNSDLAFYDLPPASPTRNYIEKIQEEAKRAAELCHLMLAYSGKGKFVIENIDVNEIIKEVTHMIEVSMSKKHSIKNDLTENLPSLDVDITQVRQVIMNLIINASEAIGKNDGVISVSTRTVECGSEGYQRCKSIVLAEVLPIGQYVVIEVTDTGVGMDKATIDKIFDPLFTTKFTGRGLGMSAVLGIIRGHKGAINVESKPGKGTKFTVFLPSSRETSSTAKLDREETAAPWRGSGTVLVVDDEKAVRGVGKSMLEKIGFKIITAADGQKGVEIFRDRAVEVNCVLLDLSMPGMSGEECLYELRKIRKDIRVIVYSGYDAEEIAKRFIGQRVNGFLQKPFNLKTLRNKMSKVFESN